MEGDSNSFGAEFAFGEPKIVCSDGLIIGDEILISQTAFEISDNSNCLFFNIIETGRRSDSLMDPVHQQIIIFSECILNN